MSHASTSFSDTVKEVKVIQSCQTLCDPMDCSLPGSSVHGIFQAIVLEWIAISFSRGSSRPSDQSQVSCTAGGFFTAEPPGKPEIDTVLGILHLNVSNIHNNGERVIIISFHK